MSSRVEYTRCVREGGKRGRGDGKVNLSETLLYGVQTEGALHKGLINGTMSRSGGAIRADDLALCGYLQRSGAADDLASVGVSVWICSRSRSGRMHV